MNTRIETDDLRKDVAAVRRDLDALASKLGQIAASETAGLVAELRGQVDRLIARGESAVNTAGEKAGDAAARLETAVERNPITAIAIAIGVGYVLGCISHRGR